MKPHERVLLLAELFGTNVDRHIFNVLQSIEVSNSYKKLLKNVEAAKRYNVPSTEEFLKTYEEMKFSTISTLKDAFIARATIDHLSFISSPRYFINPLLYNKEEMDSKLTYIEDLPCFARGNERTIENVINDPLISSKEKLKIIDTTCKKWRNNAKEVVVDKISNLMDAKKNTFKKNYYLSRSLLVDIIICACLNLFLIISFFSPLWVFKQVRMTSQFNYTSLSYLIFFILLFVYNFGTMLSYYLASRQKNEKAYCFNYLRTHSKNAFKSLEEGIFKIQLSLIDDVKNVSNMKKTPLTKYNYLKNYRRIILYLEKEEETSVEKIKKQNGLVYFFRIFVLVLLLISFVAFLVLTIVALGMGRVL